MLFLLGAVLPCQGQVPAVQVQRHGDAIVIDVEMSLAASADDAWSVLTDYEHMAVFLSNLTSSQVVSRQGDSLHVSQAGRTKVAFMSFSFAVTRAVELEPMREIRSELVKGDFKSYSSVTRIVETPPNVRITHHGEYVPKAWLPPMIGRAIIESETRKQYAEFAAEILKRRTAATRP